MVGRGTGKARLFDATGASRLPVVPECAGTAAGAGTEGPGTEGSGTEGPGTEGPRASERPGRRLVVIGYGNALRGDDAVGREVAEALWLQRDRLPAFADADFVTATQLTPEMAEEVACAGFVLFVDAATDVHPAGCVSARKVEPAGPGQQAATCYSDLTPEALLQMALDLYGRAPRAGLVTVSVASCAVSTELSPLVRAAVPVAVATAQMAVAHMAVPAETAAAAQAAVGADKAERHGA